VFQLNRTTEQGVFEYQWDAVDSRNQRIVPGLYLYTISVSNGPELGEFKGKVLVSSNN
jgi:hypothetical protein